MLELCDAVPLFPPLIPPDSTIAFVTPALVRFAVVMFPVVMSAVVNVTVPENVGLPAIVPDSVAGVSDPLTVREPPTVTEPAVYH